VIQSDSRIARRQDRAVGNRFLQQLRVVVLCGDIAVQQHVCMHIDESRQHRCLRQIDRFDPRGRASSCCHRDDFVAFNHDQRTRHRRIALSVNQAPRAYRNSLGGCFFILGLPEQGCGRPNTKCESSDEANQQDSCASMFSHLFTPVDGRKE
jgi:hypothetical protein